MEILICARDRVPKRTFGSTVKPTFTWSPSRPTLSTLPTLTPAMRTSSFGFSPLASVNAAEYFVPPSKRVRLNARTTSRTTDGHAQHAHPQGIPLPERPLHGRTPLSRPVLDHPLHRAFSFTICGVL